MKGLRWAPLLLLPALFLLGSNDAHKGGGSEGEGSVVLNLSSFANPCSAVQSYLNHWNAKDAGYDHLVLRLHGKATVNWSSLEDRGNYRSCWHIGSPTEVLDQTDDVYLKIFFDDAVLTFDSTGQTEPAILFQLGDNYDVGSTTDFVGAINNNIVTLDGSLHIETPTDTHGSWPAAKIPALPLQTNASSTTTVGMMLSGFIHSDLSAFAVSMDGVVATVDTDDVGMIMQRSFGTVLGRVRIQHFGTGFIAVGGLSSTTLTNGEIVQNNNNVVIGDHFNCTSSPHEDGTLSEGAPTEGGLAIENSNLEGAFYTQFTHFCGGVSLDNVWFENGSQSWYSMIFGAGYCAAGANAGRACVVDADCPTSTCNDAVTGDNFETVQILNSEISASGNNSYPPTIALGPSATDVSGTNILGLWINSDLPSITAPLTNLAFNPAATVPVHVSGATLATTLNAYPYTSDASGRTRLNATGTPWNFDAYDNRFIWANSLITNSASGSDETWNLPVPDVTFPPTTFCDTGGAGKVIIDTHGAGETILPFGGIAPGAGETITSDASTMTSCVTLVAASTTTWQVIAWSGRWVNQAGTKATGPLTIAQGTIGLNQTQVNASSCGAAQTATATGALTTDAIAWDFSADPSGVTGYYAYILRVYPTTDTVNVKVCNPTAGNLTPNAGVTLNWRVLR